VGVNMQTDASNEIGVRTESGTASSVALPVAPPTATMPITFKAHEATKMQSQHMPWACSKCTYNNVASARHCEVCDAPRPGDGV
jgi:hypothetical protein